MQHLAFSGLDERKLYKHPPDWSIKRAESKRHVGKRVCTRPSIFLCHSQAHEDDGPRYFVVSCASSEDRLDRLHRCRESLSEQNPSWRKAHLGRHLQFAKLFLRGLRHRLFSISLSGLGRPSFISLSTDLCCSTRRQPQPAPPLPAAASGPTTTATQGPLVPNDNHWG